jgi:5'-deoxynucleotidase YfbR-like HD superfamily hydrolase
MKKNTSVSLSDFVDSIYTLKALTRYNNKFKIINESVAEHSFFVAVLVLKMYDDYNFNLKTALKMSLIHDIPELHLSDVTHDVKKNFPKLAKEVLNAEYAIMRKKYPNWYYTFRDFESGESVEAQVVKMADNLSCVQYATAEMALGNKGYMKEVAKDAGRRVMECENKLKKYRRDKYASK